MDKKFSNTNWLLSLALLSNFSVNALDEHEIDDSTIGLGGMAIKTATEYKGSWMVQHPSDYKALMKT
jgi:hypothetical protein